jgi:hypothetical protein
MTAQATWKIASTCVLQPQGLSTFNDAAELGALMWTSSSLTLPGKRCGLGAQDPVLESFYADVAILMGRIDAY